jgi:hypothetical protein
MDNILIISNLIYIISIFSSILLVFSIFLLNDCSKKKTHDKPSNVNPAVPAGSGAVVIFNDMANFQIVEDGLYETHTSTILM